MPNERQLFKALKFGPVYARIYAPVSNQMYFSMGTAIGELLNVEEVAIEQRDGGGAAAALMLATITFGMLLEKSDRAIGHGLTMPALEVGRRFVADLREALA